MSLITSCPACGTMFRVVADQLKISEGWVRCGHCSEVFDASKHLSDESVLVEPELAQQATRPADMPTRPAEMAQESQDADAPEPPTRAAPPPGRAASESDRPVRLLRRGQPRHAEPSPLDAPFVFRPAEVLGLRDSQIPAPGEESQMLPEDFDGAEPDEDDPRGRLVRAAGTAQGFLEPSRHAARAGFLGRAAGGASDAAGRLPGPGPAGPELSRHAAAARRHVRLSWAAR
jgi:predicted Zn finger-like uncharacterized protein